MLVELGEVEVAGTGSGRSCSRIAGEVCKSSRIVVVEVVVVVAAEVGGVGK